MKRLSFGLTCLAVVSAAAACGSPTASPPKISEATKKEVEPAKPAAVAETPRKKQTRLIVDALKGEKDYKPDDHQSARIASEGLSEEESYKLPPEARKALHAVTTESIDSSQCSRILAQLVFEQMDAETTKACGDAKALGKRILAIKGESERTREAAKACKVEVKLGFGGGSAITAPALVTSVVIGRVLAADPATDADEKSIAEAIRYVCATEPSR